MPDEILEIHEVAQFAEGGRKTIYTMAQMGELRRSRCAGNGGSNARTSTNGSNRRRLPGDRTSVAMANSGSIWAIGAPAREMDVLHGL
jgi:hypothetical protein